MAKTKLLASILLSMGLVACGGGGSDSPPTTGLVYFTPDAGTCGSSTESRQFTFVINGANMGSQLMKIGVRSQPYEVGAGQVILEAAAIFPGGVYRWPKMTATLPAGGSFTYLMLCSK